MRYLCTIYTQDCTVAGNKGFVGTDPSFDAPAASVVVGGPSPRQAAANAYVRCVGRGRARLLRKKDVPSRIAALETSGKAIAASLRKTVRRIGEVYEMDNLTQAWFIKVEPVGASAPLPRRRLHVPSSRLHRLSRSLSPN